MNQGIFVGVLNEKLINLSNIKKYCCSGPFEILVAADLLCILHNKRLVMLSPISATRGEPDLFQVTFYWLIGELSLELFHSSP